MKKIPLRGNAGKNKYVLVDDEDYERLNEHKWYFASEKHKHGNGYTYYSTCKNRQYKRFYMHREIMYPTKNFEIDHIDGDGLNNQRSNLRIVTHAQNNMNRKMQYNNKSGYKGVWIITTKSNKKRYRTAIQGKYIGTYNTAKEASLAYITKAKEIFGIYTNTSS